MAKAVFTTKVNPSYDDLPELRYHFPSAYLNQAQRSVGDWIVYYEPRRSDSDLSSRGGRLAYFAMAQVSRIEPDPARAQHYYAFVENYVEFTQPVPFKEGKRYFESALRKPDGATNKGAFGRAVRLVPDDEFQTIVHAGFADQFRIHEEKRDGAGLAAEPEADYGRPIFQQVVARPFRDQAFTQVVRRAYDSVCAMTGLNLVNGGGRCEIEAAHIKPVAANGPDSPRNGLALSRTVHWMFDRGLLSAEDGGKMLVAGRLVPPQARSFLNPDGMLRWPKDPFLRPHPQFLRYHRDSVYKG